MCLFTIQAHIALFQNFMAHSESTLDSRNIGALNQNPYGEYEWDFYFYCRKMVTSGLKKVDGQNTKPKASKTTLKSLFYSLSITQG